MSLNIDKITKTSAFSAFFANREISVDSAKIKKVYFENPSTDKEQSVITLMEEIKPKVWI